MNAAKIKCRDLMVGDWITDNHGFQWQITVVGDDYAYATFEGNEGDPWEFDDKDDQPHPIEITPDLLKANGWQTSSCVLTHREKETFFVKDVNGCHLMASRGILTIWFNLGQRLILAYEQVRSAAYLGGTELRQFTEAGIPMLGELSRYFTELEGRDVCVSEVLDRISEREVTFGDVAEIFKRLTSEGGTFYGHNERAYADIIAPIKYVHQLQQVLRLAGLNELADNFKV